MAKKFAKRVSKKERKEIKLDDKLTRDLLQWTNDELLKGAVLDEIRLDQIKVKEQVRTKFNDKSLKELSENIKENGLIQPLVLHKKGATYTLICGERRFRAMGLIKKKTAPCFVLEGKSEDELMAIQFSENSSREELHYIDKADGVLSYQMATKASERKIVKALGISKSEVHRSLLIAKLPKKIKEAAKIHNIEKYVLLELDAMDGGTLKKSLEKQVIKGDITKRAELKKAIKNGGLISTTKASKAKKKTTKKKTPTLPRGLSASAFIKAMKSKSKEMKLDKETRALLNSLVEETKEIVE